MNAKLNEPVIAPSYRKRDNIEDLSSSTESDPSRGSQVSLLSEDSDSEFDESSTEQSQEEAQKRKRKHIIKKKI